MWLRPALRALTAACFYVAILAVLTGAGRPANAASDAGEFLASMTERAIAQLTDESLPLDDRKARFRVLFRENFDVPVVGRFVLGRYWRKTDPETRDAFLNVFEDVMIQRFVPKFAGYADTTFEIKRVQTLEDPAQFVVRSQISPDRGKSFEIDWRVRERNGHFKILDVIGEGISMALTLRAEYASAIKNSGGQVEDLVARLRAQVERESETQTTNSINN